MLGLLDRATQLTNFKWETPGFGPLTYEAALKTTALAATLLFAHGAGSFAETNPMQRWWRDSNTAARHAIILPTVGAELYGKALLNVENTVTPLV